MKGIIWETVKGEKLLVWVIVDSFVLGILAGVILSAL